MTTIRQTDADEPRSSLAPTGPGAYITRRGFVAYLSHQHPRGRWHGRMPSYYVRTWWHADGTHNLAISEDIVDRVPSGGERE